jgi:hypothetical protein
MAITTEQARHITDTLNQIMDANPDLTLEDITAIADELRDKLIRRNAHAASKKATVKFMKHYIQNTTTGKKCRVWYSLDNRADKRKCVTIYAKGYLDEMAGILDNFENDTDTMTDYFDKDRAVIFEGDAHYAAARARAER